MSAAASLISAIAWPLIVVFAVLVFKPELGGILEGLTEIELFGAKAKIQRKLKESADDAERSKELRSVAATPGELDRAIEVERLARGTNVSFLREQIDELAAEYERVRASMPPGDTRTRAMEVVVSKMRTIGRAAYPLRYELSASPSPGHRLQAIASLQVTPDYDLLDWLVDRIDTEKPFVAYHALVALNTAAGDERASAHLPDLQRAVGKARGKRGTFGEDTDRGRQLRLFETTIDHLAERK